jgi:sulfonate transport system substrate-binding protein
MTPTTHVAIGVHPNNSTLFVLRRSGLLEGLLAEHDAAVEWVDHPRGGQTVDLLAEGIIDVGGTGATPPLIAQSRGLDVVYLAVSPPRPTYGDLLVLADSPVASVADLRGKRVGLTEGSWQTSLLALALDDAGLRYGDVQRVSGTRTTGKAAFLAGDIDAWISGEPQHSEVLATTPVRRLVDVRRTYSNRSLWFARRWVATQHPEIAAALAAALLRTDAWIAEHPRRAAELFVHDLDDTESVETWVVALSQRAWGPRAVDDAFVDEQQRVADLLVADGFLPNPIRVADAVVAPAAALAGRGA